MLVKWKKKQKKEKKQLIKESIHPALSLVTLGAPPSDTAKATGISPLDALPWKVVFSVNLTVMSFLRRS